MIIYPAIDLKDGKAVRLNKGLMDSAKIYGEPLEIAKKFKSLGSKWLHMVDLNGAFAGEPKNLEQIKKIATEVDLNIQIGGGIRDEDTIKMYLDLGVKRVILGSIALRDPKFVEKVANKYRIVVGIDAKDGYVAVDGWANVSEIKATELAKKFANVGVEAIICTDISKDGMLSGVNIDFTKEIEKSCNLPTIASGGVKGIDDIKLCIKNNISGVIVGKAYYENKLDLKEAFKLGENN